MAGAAVVGQTRSALADAARDARQAWNRRWTAAALIVAIAILVPVLPFDVGLGRLAGDVYLAAAAVGLGIVVGIGGMPSLAHGAFVALGAFGTALLAGRSGWPVEAAVVGGTVVAALAGAGLGAIVGYLRPVLAAVVTWLVAWLVALGLLAFPSISGGAQGLSLDDGMFTATVHYELAVALAALAVLAYVMVGRSAAGIALSAARERRAAAERLGVPVARLRAATFGVGATIAGLSGALAVCLAGVADARAYGPLLSAKLFIAVVLGGAVSPIGGLVGVAVLAALDRVSEIGGVESLAAGRVETLLVAAIVVSALGATDRGLVPSLADWFRERRGQPQPPTPSSVAVARPRSVTGSASVGARQLTKRFGPITALDGVDLDLTGGSVHALIGLNGSGKTTALALLVGAQSPDSGSIVFDGEDVTASGLHERAERGIAGTMQATAVFHELTAIENVLVGARLRLRCGGGARGVVATPKARADLRVGREEALAALAVVGLAAERDVLAGLLPGAAQRRLMIASALATRPRALLLDEPSAGAGRGELDLLAELIGRLRTSGLAILLVEHNLRLVRHVADKVTVLVAGLSIAAGTVEDVLASDAVLKAYLGGRRI